MRVRPTILHPFFWVCFLYLSVSAIPVNKTETTTKKFMVYVVPLKQDIFPAAWRTIQESFEEAQKAGANLIILHINTYGGLLNVADSIRTRILNCPIPVYAFIDNNAASAGALICIATERIYMRRGSSIGAATVVSQTGEKMPDKYQSYMRSLMRSTAEAHGKDTVIQGNDTILRWRRDPKIAEAMVDESVSLPGIKDTGKILTFTTDEAIRYGYCNGEAENIPDLLQKTGISDYQLTEYKPGFIDKIISFLLNPIVHGLLIMLIIGGLYFEFQSPGVGFPLVIAITAALLYFAPLYLEGLAQNWEILIFVVGVILLGVELFVIPGFGVAGFTGIGLMIIGLTLSMVDNSVFELNTPKALTSVLKALLIVVTAIATSFFLSIYVSKQLFTKNTFGELALKTVQDTDKGYIGVDEGMRMLTGRTGKAHTMLRPSGKVLIDNDIYDAKSLIGYIDKGEDIRVIKFEAGQLYVVKSEK